VSTQTVPDDLIGIEEASVLLRRTQHTLRRWSGAGRAPNGMRLTTYRDGITMERYFSRSQIVAIRGSIFRVVPA
jgi:hypothetical protein